MMTEAQEKTPPRGTPDGARDPRELTEHPDANHQPADPQANSTAIPADDTLSGGVHDLLAVFEKRRIAAIACCTDGWQMLRLLNTPWSIEVRAKQAQWFRQRWAKATDKGQTLAEMQSSLTDEGVQYLRCEGDVTSDIDSLEETIHRLLILYAERMTPAFPTHDTDHSDE